MIELRNILGGFPSICSTPVVETIPRTSTSISEQGLADGVVVLGGFPRRLLAQENDKYRSRWE